MLTDLNGADRAKLTDVLGQAQGRGWVGGRGVEQHIEHSLGFASVVAAIPLVAVDLGSGGGLPALVLAAVWPQSKWTLVESSLPRAAFLELHCARLGWSERVDVLHMTAEHLGEDEQYRDRADLVTARSFGPPASVISAAAPLLRPGGELIASAAPTPTPWPSHMLAKQGMAPDRLTQSPPRFHRSTRTS
ncbi:MAG: class I SAM-dependent methyltransferase [bacterium]|nr:class I SAM-dependent methyltransferase [bacterium]